MLKCRERIIQKVGYFTKGWRKEFLNVSAGPQEPTPPHHLCIRVSYYYSTYLDRAEAETATSKRATSGLDSPEQQANTVHAGIERDSTVRD